MNDENKIPEWAPALEDLKLGSRVRWNELLAPKWNREKMRPMQFIKDYMRNNQMFQGRLS